MIKNEMVFEAKFEQVAQGQAWYEVYESEQFEQVKALIAAEFGVEVAEEVEGFREWEQEMAWEL